MRIFSLLSFLLGKTVSEGDGHVQECRQGLQPINLFIFWLMLIYYYFSFNFQKVKY
jgi:hypothetical protein